MPVKKTAAIPAIERIREIAYQLWVEAGQPEGAAESNWFEAERIAANEQAETPKPKKAPVRKKAA